MGSPLGHCRDHPSVPAVDVCTRCGGFACLQCVRSVRATVYCHSCLGHVVLPPPEGSPWRAWLALGLAIGGVVVVPYLAIAAIPLAAVELARIRRGQSPVRGRRYAWGALAMAVLVLLFLVSEIFAHLPEA